MASRVGRVVSKIWTFTSAARTSTPASSSAPSLAGCRSLPRFSSPSAAPQQRIFGSRRSLQFSASGDVRCIFSMIPRHNVTATARLVSKLSGDLCPELEGSAGNSVMIHKLCTVVPRSFLNITPRGRRITSRSNFSHLFWSRLAA